jgi:hypothetical protein
MCEAHDVVRKLSVFFKRTDTKIAYLRVLTTMLGSKLTLEQFPLFTAPKSHSDYFINETVGKRRYTGCNR